MDFTLTRLSYEMSGIYGLLVRQDTDQQVAVTLEHAYPEGNGPITYAPKIPEGIYVCQRGMHQLAGMISPFECFEITNVPGHSDILLHVGNTNDDSSGCVLLGGSRMATMIVQSRVTFDRFMVLLSGVDTFNLVVE